MDEAKRKLLKAMVAATVAGLATPVLAGAQTVLPAGPAPDPAIPAVPAAVPPHGFDSPINVIIPLRYAPPTEGAGLKDYQFALVRAVLEFVEKSYPDRPLPLWDKYFAEVDLEKRVTNIVYWVLQAVRSNLITYPVDPAWIMAQILAESCFNEFAISSAFAVGICQFIGNTARSYGMLCAGDRPEHAALPYRLPEYVGKLDLYNDLRSRRRALLKEAYGGKSADDLLRDVLAGLARGAPRPDAGRILDSLAQADALNEEAKIARLLYKQYLQANFEGRSIFNDRDLAFLQTFDERVTYKKPIFGMVQMMAKALRARSGNIIAAAAGYNAGLGNTHESGLYEPYGVLPNIGETVTYVSHIFINHHEIAKRMGGPSWTQP
jgi:soluble lytic murein transglycosylase-like protein